MFSKEARFHEIKEELVNAFHKLKIYKVIIKQAVRAAEKEKNYQLIEYLEFCKEGTSEVNNKCDKCGSKLLEGSAIADSFLRKTKDTNENKLHREESKKQSKYTEEQQFVYQGMGIDITGNNAQRMYAHFKEFVVFRCQEKHHKFHKTCVLASQKEQLLKQLASAAPDSDEYHKIKDAMYQNKEPKSCIICIKYKINDDLGI